MGYRLRWPKKNLTHCPGWVDHYTAVQDEAGVAQHFSGPFRYEVLPGCGHNIPQEAPAAFAAAVRERLP